MTNKEEDIDNVRRFSNDLAKQRSTCVLIFKYID